MFMSLKINEIVFALYSGVWQNATLISIDSKIAEIKLHENKAVKENVKLELGIKILVYLLLFDSRTCQNYSLIK
jgi:hypothetical protein